MNRRKAANPTNPRFVGHSNEQQTPNKHQNPRKCPSRTKEKSQKRPIYGISETLTLVRVTGLEKIEIYFTIL